MPAGCLPGDQGRQLKRLNKTDVSDLPSGRLGNEQILVLERPLEDSPRVALRGRRRSSPGPSGKPSLSGHKDSRGKKTDVGSV